MLDIKDLENIESIFNRKFLEIEDRLDKKIDDKLESFKKQFTLESSNILMEEQLNNRIISPDKIIDLLTEYSNEDYRKNSEYIHNFSKINSKLLDHELRLISLEARSTISE